MRDVVDDVTRALFVARTASIASGVSRPTRTPVAHGFEDPPHRRDGAAARRFQADKHHHLHWRRQPAAAVSQASSLTSVADGGLALDVGPPFDARRRRRGDRCAGRLDLQAFGSHVELFEAGPRILTTEDEDVAAVVAAVFRQEGMVVRENFGVIESFEQTSSGVQMTFSKDGKSASVEAALAVIATDGSPTPWG